MTMVDPPEDATPRPRPRPGQRVAGRRQKAAPRAVESGALSSSTDAAEAAASRTAADKAAGTKRPRPPRTDATKAAAVQAAAAKAAAARRSGTRGVTAKSGAKPATAKPASAKPATRTSAPPSKAAKPSAPPAKSTQVAATARRTRQRPTGQPRLNLTFIVLSVLTVLAAAAVTFLVVERATTPPLVDPELLPAAKDAYAAMYSFDYTDPDGSVENSLAVLTGDLRERFEDDLNGQVVESYLEVSATTRVDNITVGLQNINAEQTEAVVIAYGTFVVKSVNSGQEPAPEGSECAVTNDGADACVQTLQLNLELVDGTWLVSNVTTLTES